MRSIKILKFNVCSIGCAPQTPKPSRPRIWKIRKLRFSLGECRLSNPTSFNQADTNSIGIRQKFPFFGKLGLKEKIAQREVKIVEQELRAKEREIISMVKMAYADLFMAERSIEILREQLEIMRTVIGATEARYQVGRVTQQDVFKALVGTKPDHESTHHCRSRKQRRPED